MFPLRIVFKFLSPASLYNWIPKGLSGFISSIAPSEVPEKLNPLPIFKSDTSFIKFSLTISTNLSSELEPEKKSRSKKKIWCYFKYGSNRTCF